MNKKHIIITSVLVIISFAVGFFAGDTAAINRVNKAIDTKVSSEASTAGNNQASNGSKKEDKKIYKAGEEGKSGNWNVKVLDAQETTTIQGGDSSDNKTTSQKFIIIKLQMTNTSQSPIQYSPKEFELGNLKDKKQYQANMDAGETANQKETIYNKNSEFTGVYDDVNPNTPKQTYIVFEVPKDFNIADGILINANGNSDAVGYNLK